jgi:hypothetical protein
MLRGNFDETIEWERVRQEDLQQLLKLIILSFCQFKIRIRSHHFSLSDWSSPSKIAQPNSQRSIAPRREQFYCVELALLATQVTAVDNILLHPRRVVILIERNMEDPTVQKMTL